MEVVEPGHKVFCPARLLSRQQQFSGCHPGTLVGPQTASGDPQDHNCMIILHIIYLFHSQSLKGIQWHFPETVWHVLSRQTEQKQI